MTVLEAMKTGRPFRRSSWRKGVWAVMTPEGRVTYQNGGFVLFTVDMLESTDWELMPDNVEAE